MGPDRSAGAGLEACGGAQVDQHAVLAARAAGIADAAPVPDEQMRKPCPVGPRHHPLEIAFDLHRILLTREAETLREATHMRVDDDPLSVPELGGDDVRRLARDPRQPQELLESPRYLTVELLEQHAHRAPDRLRLLPEEPGRVDVALQL